MHRRAFLASSCVLLAGCTEGGSPTVEIIFDLGSSAVDSGKFVADGQVRTYARRTSQEFTFTDVAIVMYTADQEQLATGPIGTLTTQPGENRVNVNFEAPARPAFILVESPEFWNADVRLSISGYRLSDSSYLEYVYSSRADRFQ